VAYLKVVTELAPGETEENHGEPRSGYLVT